MLPLFYKLRETVFNIFSGRNLLLHILACLLTYIIVVSSFDWNYYIWIQSWSISAYFTPAIFIGMIIPMFGIPILYLIGKLSGNKKLLNIVWAVTQSAALGWIISSTYKAFTGRVQPPHFIQGMLDTSHDWNFGFFEHGIFWGWPSSHTTVAFAMATALIALFPKNKTVLVTALIYAFYIGIGVSTRIHWVSEFAAGAIIGSIIGIVVGTTFRKR